MRSYLQKHTGIKYSDDYSTPKDIYKQYVLDKNYYDPCELYHNDTDLQNDLIDQDMFINPPYSNIGEWCDFAIKQSELYRKHIILLIPSRTDTKYFHRLLEHGVDLEFIKGRLTFGTMKTPAPFPSVLVHFNRKEE